MCVTLTGMNPTTALPFMSYPVAASRFRVSVRTLSRLVAEGSVTAHPSQRDKRRVLLDPHEIADALGVDLPTAEERPEERATVTVLEIAQALLVAAGLSRGELYRRIRSTLTEEVLEPVTAIVGGPEHLATLDTAAGYSPVEES